METNKIKLVYRQSGEWDYDGCNTQGCVYDTWACRYALDIDKTAEANSDINRDMLLDYIDNNIADMIAVYTDDITQNEVDANWEDLGGLDWRNYEYYTYIDEIRYCDPDTRHSIVWVDVDSDVVTAYIDM